MRRGRLAGLIAGILSLGCSAEPIEAPRPAPRPAAETSEARHAMGVRAAVWRALEFEAGAGRRVVFAPLEEKRMPWVDVAGALLCLGRGCRGACVAELRLSGPGCGTGRGRGPDVITVIAAGCGADRSYTYEVEYEPLTLAEAPEVEEVAPEALR